MRSPYVVVGRANFVVAVAVCGKVHSHLAERIAPHRVICRINDAVLVVIAGESRSSRSVYLHQPVAARDSGEKKSVGEGHGTAKRFGTGWRWIGDGIEQRSCGGVEHVDGTA